MMVADRSATSHTLEGLSRISPGQALNAWYAIALLSSKQRTVRCVITRRPPARR